MKELLSIRQQRKILRKYCRHFRVRFRLKENLDAAGYAYHKTSTIVICAIPQTRDELISTMMHELTHILAGRLGKYKVYHDWRGFRTKRELNTYKRTALIAEIYVDSWAKRLTRAYFPEVKYQRAYTTRKSKDWFKNRIKKLYRNWDDFRG